MRIPVLRLGRLCATPAALDALAKANTHPIELLRRHAVGDFGQIPPRMLTRTCWRWRLGNESSVAIRCLRVTSASGSSPRRIARQRRCFFPRSISYGEMQTLRAQCGCPRSGPLCGVWLREAGNAGSESAGSPPPHLGRKGGVLREEPLDHAGGEGEGDGTCGGGDEGGAGGEAARPQTTDASSPGAGDTDASAAIAEGA